MQYPFPAVFGTSFLARLRARMTPRASTPSAATILPSIGRCVLLAASLCYGPSLPAQTSDRADRLLNLSSQALVGTGEAAVTAGFVVGDGPPKPVLIRAVGPALAEFGVEAHVADPQLTLYDAAGTVVATNDNWAAASAATFPRVGAFDLPTGSADAVIAATLPPGSYTAQMRSATASAAGTGLIEVYDVSGAARLTNLSTRALVAAHRPSIVSGIVVAPEGGSRRVLLRAVGPSLHDYGLPNALSDPALALVHAADGRQIAASDNWTTEDQAEVLPAAFAQSGAFPLDPTAKDAAVLVDLPPGAYAAMVSGVDGATGPVLVEIYDLTPADGVFVSALATVPSTNTDVGTPPGVITFSRTGSLDRALTLNLRSGGTARSGTDYDPLPPTVTIPAGAASPTLVVRARPADGTAGLAKIVSVTVLPGEGYEPGLATTARVSLAHRPSTLFLGTLHPLDADSGSTAYGSVVLQLAFDERSALVNASFANLSSPITTIYLRLGTPGDNGAYLQRFPAGQIENLTWNFADTDGYTAEELAQALKEGKVYLSVETAEHPGGELAGALVQGSGGSTFTPPPAPPAVASAPADDTAAARFLTQATFGPTLADIARVKELGYHGWIDEQMAAPPSHHRALTVAEFLAVPDGAKGNGTRPGWQHRISAWFKIALNGPDQLRQRVAFALSEILVISDDVELLSQWQEGVANYYDILSAHAFGNFRNLLQDVTLSPIMGIYLSHLRNPKADPATGSSPDENYAREIMQLFTIGLHELHPDGTRRLDAFGRPIPTYDNEVITETARVLTGWAFHHANPADASRFRRGEADFLNAMSLYPDFHDDGAKTIVTGRVLPAGQGGEADLRQLLDTLFTHPNTGPFIARHLIQRLVTSNPSPAFVYRVAQVFADNGRGERGDLGAVVRAILTDHEARSETVARQPGAGKLREPLLRLTALFRTLAVSAPDGRLDVPELDTWIEQQPLGADSVFNFFTPDYAPPGPLAAAGLVAPEFQILTDTTAIAGPNLYYAHIFQRPNDIRMSFDRLLPQLDDPDALLATLNLLLAGNALSPPTLERLRRAWDDLPADLSTDDRLGSLVYLVMMAPEAAVQR